MQRIRTPGWILLWMFTMIGATEAWGQTGLYGAPEVIPFPPSEAASLEGRVLPEGEWAWPGAGFGPSAPYQGVQKAPGLLPAPESWSSPPEKGHHAPYGVAPSAVPSRSSGAYRYAQAPVPYGVSAGAEAGGRAMPPVEAPPEAGPPEPPARPLPYVETDAPTSLEHRSSWPVPPGDWTGQSRRGLTSSGSSAPPQRADRHKSSGGNSSETLVDRMLGQSEHQSLFGQVGTSESPLAQAVEGPSGLEPSCCWGFLVPECPWYVRLMVLMMGRDEPNRFWTSYQTDNNPNQLMHTNDIGLAWRAGGEVRFGRRFGCTNSWAVEAAYWTLDPFDGKEAISHPNGVSTPINLEYVWFYRSAADWNMAADLFDNAVQHYLRRGNELHNVEINFLRLQRLWDPHFPLDLHWGLGARWLRFEEDLLFGSLRSGTWGANGGRNEAYIDQQITNDLIGGQLTLEMTYFIHRNWRIFLTPRVGIYNNHIQLDFQVYRGDGTAASVQPASGVVATYPVRARTDTLSFLTQLDAGVEWHFAKHWTAAIGYRVIVATGMGLADQQFPAYLIDLPEVGHIDHNGHLILHGGFASLTVTF